MLEQQKIVIVDYGMGNLLSVKRTIERQKLNALISSRPDEILTATKLILPGVGHFGKAMEELTRRELVEALNHKVLQQKTPVLGICLGMQLMASSSEEGNVEGLNWIPGRVKRFQVEDKQQFKVPHIGWNSVDYTTKHELFTDIPSGEAFYFVHSYHYVLDDTLNELCSSEYSYRFTSGVQHKNVLGVQFHPEKSHDIGARMLLNFIQI